MDVGFVGEWVTTSTAYVAKMSKAVERVAPEQKVVLAGRRAFVHNVAHDMGFQTTSEGEEGNRFVVISKL